MSEPDAALNAILKRIADPNLRGGMRVELLAWTDQLRAERDAVREELAISLAGIDLYQKRAWDAEEERDAAIARAERAEAGTALMQRALGYINTLTLSGFVAVWHENASDWMPTCPCCLKLPDIETHSVSHKDNCDLVAALSSDAGRALLDVAAKARRWAPLFRFDVVDADGTTANEASRALITAVDALEVKP